MSIFKKIKKYTHSEIHNLLIKRVEMTSTKEYEDAQALNCPYYVALNGILGMDWGVIVNPRSPKFGQLVFEHDECGCWDHKDAGWGSQTGRDWIEKEKK